MALDLAVPTPEDFDPPPFIPVVKYQHPGQALPPYPMYGITLPSIFTDAMNPTQQASDLRRCFGIHEASKLIWIPFETDDLLEELWRRRKSLLPHVGTAGLDYAIAPNFSVYGNHPRMYHLFNFRRSLVMARDLARVGVGPIVHVYFWRDIDVERWSEWLDLNPSVHWICVNFQTNRSGEYREQKLAHLSMLRDLCHRPVGLLAVGCSSAQSIREIASLGYHTAVAHQRAHQLAKAFHTVDENGRAVAPSDPSVSYEEVIARNITDFAALTARALGRSPH